MHEALKEYSLGIKQKVSFGDMDSNGHVNNVWFFRYLENARVAYYKEMGKFELEKEAGLTFVVGSTSCRFKSPVKFPDELLVGVRVSEIYKDRFLMQYLMLSSEQGKVVAKAEATCVCIDKEDGKKATIPSSCLDKIKKIENTKGSFTFLS